MRLSQLSRWFAVTPLHRCPLQGVARFSGNPFAVVLFTVASLAGVILSGQTAVADESASPASVVVAEPNEANPGSEENAGDTENAIPADSVEYFETHVQPLLAAACYDCHSHDSGESAGLLMLDSAAAIRAGGTRGTAVVAGDPAASLILRAVLYGESDLQMPPDGKLPDQQIALLKAWIEAGAVMPAADPAEAMSAASAPARDPLDHWAYQSPRRAFASESIAGSEAIDALLTAKLQQRGLQFSPAADRRTLFRRLHFDLTGLPPSFADVVRFENDPRPDDVVVAEAIDALLASPHFGERWARHWMDLARYADTKGYVFQEDREYPEAYRYRDWLINAFNRDLPYAEFVRLQLAADLQTDAQDELPALGFLTLGRRFLNNKHDIIDDRLDVVSRGLMGMTLACARCHDHKYDPVSQADYYSLFGVFLNTDEPGGEPFAHRLVDADKPRQARILVRGNPGSPGDEVHRRFVSFLDPSQTPFGEGSGRNELAAQITADTNPLTARVLVNRVWMHLMGDSLTESPSDFGTRCPPPLQQDLLDQMAVEFQLDQGSIKRLIRRIVSSRAYRQASLIHDAGEQADPANTLYWRANRQRQDLEAMRDGLLVASGRFDATLNGPAVKIDQAPFPNRRTIYAYLDRQNLPGFFRNFDMASLDAHSPARPQTSVPQQGLYLLNSDFVAEMASELGRQTRELALREGPDEAISWLVRQVLSRSPEPAESTLLKEFLDSPVDSESLATEIRWLCGYGTFHPETSRLQDFTPLPAYRDGRWQGVDGVPDGQIGWAHLTADGGHPGNSLSHAVVRRWIAPQDGTVRINGTLKHPSEEGDGVRATVLVAGDRVGQWDVHHDEAKTAVDSIDVHAGQFIDFVTDCKSGPGHDSFSWTVRIRYQGTDRLAFDSQKQHPTPQPEPLDRWAMLAQALLASNEFAFID